MAERPGEAIQMTQVAARSGVNAATLYRRWGSVDALILDVLLDDVAASSPITATGDVRHDLLRYARGVRKGVDEPNGLQFLQAIATVGATPDGDAAIQELMGRRLEQVGVLLRDSAAAPAHELTALDIVDGIVAPISYRRMIGAAGRLSDADLERLVDRLLCARG